jgi:hypothetical protein
VSSQRFVGASKRAFDVVSPLLGVEAHLGDGALDPEQLAIHDGQTCLAPDLLSEKGSLIIPSFAQTGSVQRYGDDGLHGKGAVPEVFAGQFGERGYQRTDVGVLETVDGSLERALEVANSAYSVNVQGPIPAGRAAAR